MEQIVYVIVSTMNQNTARQLQSLPMAKIFEDKCSGKYTKRPSAQSVPWVLHEADTLHVHSLDRLARDVESLLALGRELTAKGITAQLHKEGLAFRPEADESAIDMSRLMLTIMGAIAEFELSIISERQREGHWSWQDARQVQG